MSAVRITHHGRVVILVYIIIQYYNISYFIKL